MVEPLSLLAISGVSALGGLFLGKVAKKPVIVDQIVEQGIEFIALRENVKSKQLLPIFRKQKSVFINLRDLTLERDEYSQFIKEVQAMGDECNMKISSVSNTLLYVTPRDKKINIRTLTRAGPTILSSNITDDGS